MTDASGRIRRYDRATLALQSTLGGVGPSGPDRPRSSPSRPTGASCSRTRARRSCGRSVSTASVLRSFGAARPRRRTALRPVAASPPTRAATSSSSTSLGQRLQKFTAAGALVWARGPLAFSDPGRIGTAPPSRPGRAARSSSRTSTRSAWRSTRPAGRSCALLRRRTAPVTGSSSSRSAWPSTTAPCTWWTASAQTCSASATDGSFQARFGAPGGGPGEFLQPAGDRGRPARRDLRARRGQLAGRDLRA